MCMYADIHTSNLFQLIKYQISENYAPLAFTPLNELVQSLSPDQYTRWNKLYMVSDRRGSLTHPLIYPHPLTRKEVRKHHHVYYF